MLGKLQAQTWARRAFLRSRWLSDTHPDLAQLHLHSDRALRHGLTLLKASGRLATAPGARLTASGALWEGKAP